MLTNPFENLERIIHAELLQKSKIHSFPSSDYFEQVTSIIEEDGAEIFTHINTIRTKHTSIEEVTWGIHAIQEKLDNLLGTIGIVLEEMGLTIDTDPVLPDGWHTLVIKVADFLFESMAFLHGRHPDLFDTDLPMCPIAMQMFAKERINEIKEEISKIPEEPELFKVLSVLRIPFEKQEENYLCYRHIGYFNKLIADVKDILQKETVGKSAAEIIKALLWRINFNHPGYVNVIRNEYLEKLGDSEGKERLKKCLDMKRDLKANNHAIQIHLFPEGSSLQNQMITWVNTEINCIRALMVAESIITVNPFSGFKIRTSLSVSQLAGVLRLFFENGLFQYEDRQKMLQFFATFFISEKGKSITSAALIRHYDKSGREAAMKRVKDYIQVLFK